MADIRISDLTSDATPTGDDFLVTVDNGSGQTKKTTIQDMFENAPDESIPSSALTEVTADKLGLGADSASETAGGTTTSTSYTATLSGSPGTNPSVTVDVPASGQLLVLWGAELQTSSTGSRTFCAPAMSGANTVAASDTYSIHCRTATTHQYGNAYLFTGLNPGSTTITLQYRVTANTGTIAMRLLSVIPLG